MSGGSFDYAYIGFKEFADDLRGMSSNPLHLAFAAHIDLVAKAAHDIEWVFSGDMAHGEDEAAIKAVLAPGAFPAMARTQVLAAMDNLRTALKEENPNA